MIRSAGITDLRHGNVVDADWQRADRFEHHHDLRRPTPLPAGIQHFAIAATLSKRPGGAIGKLLGDGLVHPSSATGRHDDPIFDLEIPAARIRIIHGVNHWGLLHEARVYRQLRDWLVRAA
jgi:hypothetical protein